MLPQTEQQTKEPIHLLVLRGIIYSASLAAAVWPMAGLAVNAAVVTAALTGVILGRIVAATRLRTWAAVAGGLFVAVSGWGLAAMLGSSTMFAHSVGLSTAMSLVQGIALSMMTFGVVTALRVVTLRYRSLALLEVAAAAAVAVMIFAGHRDYQIAQPRFLSDWAFSTGRDPWLVLLIAGLGTLCCVLMFLLPKQKASRNFAALVLLFGAMALLLWGFGGEAADLAGRLGAASSNSQNDDPLDFQDRKDPESEKKIPIALIAFHDSFTPYEDTYHFRDGVYSQLTGAKYKPASLPGVNLDIPTEFATATISVPGVELPAHLSRDVRTSVGLIAKLPAPLVLPNPKTMSPEDNPDPKYFNRSYAVTSRVLAIDKRPKVNDALLLAPAGDPSWSDEMRRHYVEPTSDPRYKELADKIVDDAVKNGKLPATMRNSAYARGIVMMWWLQDNTVYSFTPGNGNLPDPTADFLFGSHKGFCVHFSTAMTHMLRSQGVPARVATGFAAPLSRRGQGSSLLVQKSDAHAWCEIYLQGIGWVPLDSSPKRSESAQPPPPSPELKNFLQNKFEEKRNQKQTTQVPTPENNDGLEIREIAKDIGLLGTLLMLVLLAVIYSVKLWRQWAPLFASERHVSRVCFRAVLDRFADMGVLRQIGESREQFAERLKAIAPELATFTQHHLRAAMGATGNVDRATWLKFQTVVGLRLETAFTWWRRGLGRLNPIGWMFVR